MSEEDVVLQLLVLNEGVRSLNFVDRLNFFQRIEREYETEADNELGDFLNAVVWSMINYGERDDFYNLLQEVVYDSEMDPEILATVCGGISTLLSSQTTQACCFFILFCISETRNELESCIGFFEIIVK
jgi:hypothetical protein